MKLKQKLRAVKSPATMTNIIKVVLCCLVFHGCNEDPSMFEDTDLHETDSKFVNPLDFIGQSHNQGLDYIFNNLETPDKGLKSAQSSKAKIIS